MEINEYQKLAMRTSAPHETLDSRLNNAILGLCGETGELANVWKKSLYHGHTLRGEDLVQEIGDILWYVAQAADAIGADLEEVAQRNIEKLRSRYPEGFASERSINR
jgi:NTP pyrophosphatase (non-canonical NTP hydrolase)